MSDNADLSQLCWAAMKLYTISNNQYHHDRADPKKTYDQLMNHFGIKE